jgi:crooked neck
LEAKNIENTRQVYQKCLKVIPHKIFTFKRIWIMFANFEIRQKNLQAARQIFGHAIGLAPHEKIFKPYIQLELQIGNVERCRMIYEKWLEWNPPNCEAWVSYAHLERDLGETERCRAIFELAVSQQLLDMPEILWKSFIDFEIEQQDYENARKLYKRLLERTKHVKVWVSSAQFEASIENYQAARDIYSQAYDVLKTAENKEERVLLVESWRDFEKSVGDKQHLAEVEKKMPKKVVKKRPVKAQDGTDAGWEEYYDFIFPGEEAAAGFLKLLEKARQWKKGADEQ